MNIFGDSYNVEAFFGTVTIFGKQCSVRGCGVEPVCAMPLRTTNECGVYWLCAEHGTRLQSAIPNIPIYEIIRTCQTDLGGGVRCGKLATHFAM